MRAAQGEISLPSTGGSLSASPSLMRPSPRVRPPASRLRAETSPRPIRLSSSSMALAMASRRSAARLANPHAALGSPPDREDCSPFTPLLSEQLLVPSVWQISPLSCLSSGSEPWDSPCSTAVKPPCQDSHVRAHLPANVERAENRTVFSYS